MAVQCADKFARLRVPQPHGSIVRGGGQQAAVGAERNGIYPAFVTDEVLDLFTRRNMENQDDPARVGGGQQFAVRAERDTGDRGNVFGKRADFVSRRNVPKLNCLVRAAGCQGFTQGRGRRRRRYTAGGPNHDKNDDRPECDRGLPPKRKTPESLNFFRGESHSASDASGEDRPAAVGKTAGMEPGETAARRDARRVFSRSSR